MIRHLFAVSGLDAQGNKFTGACVADDIIKAISIFRTDGYTPHRIEQNQQMSADYPEGITCLNSNGQFTIIAKGTLTEAEKRAIIRDHFRAKEENHE